MLRDLEVDSIWMNIVTKRSMLLHLRNHWAIRQRAFVWKVDKRWLKIKCRYSLAVVLLIVLSENIYYRKKPVVITGKGA